MSPISKYLAVDLGSSSEPADAKPADAKPARSWSLRAEGEALHASLAPGVQPQELESLIELLGDLTSRGTVRLIVFDATQTPDPLVDAFLDALAGVIRGWGVRVELRRADDAPGR